MSLKAVIQVDGLTSGYTVDNIAPLPVSILDNGVETFPNAGKAGSGWAIYDAHRADFFFQDDGTISNITTSAGFSPTVDNAGTVNIYKVGADIIIQNKTGLDKDLLLYIMAA